MKALVLILGASALLFFAGLGGATLFDQDEAKYTQVAREILQTGDPITLHVNGSPWFVHPPLYVWLVAATGRALGFTEFTARVWSAIFGLLGIYATYLVGRRLFSPRAALLASAVLPSTFQYFAHARLAVFDGALVTFMLLAFYAWLRARAGEPRYLYVAAVWAGLGTLTKGPIALLLPGLVVGTFLLLRRVRAGRVSAGDGMAGREAAKQSAPMAAPERAIRRFPIIGPALVYAALALPWYLVEWIRHGWPFVQTVIGYYTVNRFLGVVEGQSGPWWYYGPVYGLGMFPWTAFGLAMIVYHLRRRAADGSLLVLLWIGITTAFYTAAGTKLPNYVLPAYPAAALGIGAMWDAALRGARDARVAVAAAFAGTILALLVSAGEVAAFARLKYPADLVVLQRHLSAVAIVLGVWLVSAAALYAARRPRLSFVALVATMWVLGGILVVRTLPLVEARRPIKAVAAAVRAHMRPGVPLVGYRISDHQTLLFYTNHRVHWVDDFAQLVNLVCYQPRMVVAMRPADLRGVQVMLPSYAAATLTPVTTTEALVVVETRPPPSCRVPAIGR